MIRSATSRATFLTRRHLGASSRRRGPYRCPCPSVFVSWRHLVAGLRPADRSLRSLLDDGPLRPSGSPTDDRLFRLSSFVQDPELPEPTSAEQTPVGPPCSVTLLRCPGCCAGSRPVAGCCSGAGSRQGETRRTWPVWRVKRTRSGSCGLCSHMRHVASRRASWRFHDRKVVPQRWRISTAGCSILTRICIRTTRAGSPNFADLRPGSSVTG